MGLLEKGLKYGWGRSGSKLPPIVVTVSFSTSTGPFDTVLENPLALPINGSISMFAGVSGSSSGATTFLWEVTPSSSFSIHSVFADQNPAFLNASSASSGDTGTVTLTVTRGSDTLVTTIPIEVA